jgi:hypothetical protein
MSNKIQDIIKIIKLLNHISVIRKKMITISWRPTTLD